MSNEMDSSMLRDAIRTAEVRAQDRPMAEFAEASVDLALANLKKALMDVLTGLPAEQCRRVVNTLPVHYLMVWEGEPLWLAAIAITGTEVEPRELFARIAREYER